MTHDANGTFPEKKKGKRMPRQNRHASNQIVATPDDFLEAVERRFGSINWDLAANSENCVVPADESPLGGYLAQRYFGPGSPFHEDSLAGDCRWPVDGLLWLNPPFADIAPWAKKCAEWRELCWREHRPYGALLLMLVPYSAGANYWAEHIAPHADQIAITGRIKFVGHEDWYPKDLALCVYDPTRYGLPTVAGRWKWREDNK